ncbi:hypothetical protein GCM10010441_48500 [Kitasatospora paracochleata]|uniref:DUF4192 domain-containing protein n=1 Tax=Kitasatospora paracochleata TaxID=58354 RepID=A0ABT1IRY0_9ACTN|nr:DUF4192 domain-containing protein [Kitasatospora paracochleata]MCP2307869.1 hypothetical protein [Kitasatospora paracochleata]
MNDDRTTVPAPIPGPIPTPIPGQIPVRMRGPADMAEMLPYLLGFFPDDSIVAVGLQGAALEQGGVIRIDIPDDPEHWPRVAAETARLLVELSEQRDRRPDQVLIYLCRDPEPCRGGGSGGGGGPGDPAEPVVGGWAGRAILERLRPLAQALAGAFETHGVSVKESLCVSDGRWRSFLCTGPSCCDPDGTPIRPAHHPSPLAAAATFAGLAPRGSRKAIMAGLSPVGPPLSEIQRRAVEDAGPPFIRELAGPDGRQRTVERTGELLAEAMTEFRSGACELDATRTARLLVGLQDKLGRDRGAEYAEPHELIAAQRLWRFLIQRCVSPFDYLATPPLTLLAWTSWLGGDSATARIVLSRALDLDPGYTLAQLLYESLNAGLAPDKLLEAVRRERSARTPRGGARPATEACDPEPITDPTGPGEGGGDPVPVEPGGPPRAGTPDSGPAAPAPAAEEVTAADEPGGIDSRRPGAPTVHGTGDGPASDAPPPGDGGGAVPPVGEAAAGGGQRLVRRRIRLRGRLVADHSAVRLPRGRHARRYTAGA